MTTVDVNEAFRQERLSLIQGLRDGQADAVRRAAEYNRGIEARIADGKLVPIGDGQYRVEEPGSWDNGEVWTYRRMSTQAPPLLLPVHGLDETAGKVALYTRYPEWHDVGNVVPEGVSDLDEVLRLGGIDWSVEQRDVRYNFPRLGQTKAGKEIMIPESRIVPDMKVNVRSDTGAPLGVVGKIYTPLQNRDGAAFLQELVDRYNVVFESAGATFDGRHVFIGMKLPDTVELNLGDGVTDLIEPFIFWRNTHDGTASLSLVVTPWRIACGNTERFAMRDALSSWRVRHTTNVLQRVEEARKALGLTVKFFEHFKTEEEQLARNEMLMGEFQDLLGNLWPVKEDATDRQKRGADERNGILTSMFRAETDKLGWRAYTAERVITDFADHVAPKRVAGDQMGAARATAIVEGTADGLKTRAHELLMQRVRK